MPLLACAGSALNDGSVSGAAGAGTDDTGTGADDSCTQIPEETAGPYPGDGTNGENALTLTGIVRSDIRASVAGASGVAEGVPLTVTLTSFNGQNGCEPLAGYAVYLRHCDRAGNYSVYSSSLAVATSGHNKVATSQLALPGA